MYRLLFFSLLLCFTNLSCYYDSEEDLYPNVTCDTTNVKYSVEIKAIINNNCIGCHSAAANQGDIQLENHADVLKYANNGRLLGSIKHAATYVAMPTGAPKLSDCNISKVEAWINAGSPNN
jgi:hypothetical protein